jgi:hypothetical protein
MIHYASVAGTHGYRENSTHEWWQATSPFSKHLTNHGFEPYSTDFPFIWSTNLVIGGSHSEWRVAGQALFYYFVSPIREGRVPPSESRVICHSHGLQVVLYALAAGLKLDTLVDVCGPVRADMEPVARLARKNVRRWLHLTGGTDLWQILGTMFDGKTGAERAHPLADENIQTPQCGHSDLLLDPWRFPLWEKNGWLQFLATGSRVS